MKECIILAGGLGTRLQSVVKDVPKCMAEVSGKPFLHYLLSYLIKENFEHIILSLGYKSDIVINWLSTLDLSVKISHVIESEPLGTGGAIKLAFQKVQTQQALVINGDTFFDINTDALINFHDKKSADISITLKSMTDFDRYGSVETNSEGRIVKFNEKQYCTQGLINGGVYLINKNIFNNLDFPKKFSFEKDVMEERLDSLKIYGCEQNSYFIDIGIPSDFEKANLDFKNRI
ncbi:nucleotidyltransferase family protein [Dysgonomonas sp. ZJ279]|uniref:nucleotidyltransferase family protein n=1 Tax=Dysgonomonas sp. ZJ279 TaxID=2709796 RepID=UPI0013EDDA7F|nr:nucleotidyltransferase family protein [Dysgonomonas sp. ZJ279]